MSRRSNKNSELIPITDKDLDRFHQNAEKALDKRTSRYLLQEVFEGFPQGRGKNKTGKNINVETENTLA